MATYLLTWNPGKAEWPDLSDDYESVFLGNRPRIEWSCGNTKKIAVGDRVFMMRLGWREPVTGIMASGWVTDEPIEGPHWDVEQREKTAWYVEFELDALLNPSIHALLDPVRVSPDFRWRPQSSGVTIHDDIAAQLELVWHQHLQDTDLPTELLVLQKVEESSHKKLIEGSKKLVSSHRYERSLEARDKCIKHYGTQCQICGFDFTECYGSIGEGFIHVHHLIPLSMRNEEYELDPICDLLPVCPNCHAMLHRRSPPYSLAELREIMAKQAS
jgi:5-methylcytosine-specific restriction protein A